MPAVPFPTPPAPGRCRLADVNGILIAPPATTAAALRGRSRPGRRQAAEWSRRQTGRPPGPRRSEGLSCDLPGAPPGSRPAAAGGTGQPRPVRPSRRLAGSARPGRSAAQGGSTPVAQDDLSSPHGQASSPSPPGPRQPPPPLALPPRSWRGLCRPSKGAEAAAAAGNLLEGGGTGSSSGSRGKALVLKRQKVLKAWLPAEVPNPKHPEGSSLVLFMPVVRHAQHLCSPWCFTPNDRSTRERPGTSGFLLAL